MHFLYIRKQMFKVAFIPHTLFKHLLSRYKDILAGHYLETDSPNKWHDESSSKHQEGDATSTHPGTKVDACQFGLNIIDCIYEMFIYQRMKKCKSSADSNTEAIMKITLWSLLSLCFCPSTIKYDFLKISSKFWPNSAYGYFLHKQMAMFFHQSPINADAVKVIITNTNEHKHIVNNYKSCSISST